MERGEIKFTVVARNKNEQQCALCIHTISEYLFNNKVLTLKRKKHSNSTSYRAATIMQLTIPMCRELNFNHISAAKSTFYFAEYKEERLFFIGNQSLDMLWHKQKTSYIPNNIVCVKVTKRSCRFTNIFSNMHLCMLTLCFLKFKFT